LISDLPDKGMSEEEIAAAFFVSVKALLASRRSGYL
jgi:hypothetical protein